MGRLCRHMRRSASFKNVCVLIWDPPYHRGKVYRRTAMGLQSFAWSLCAPGYLGILIHLVCGNVLVLHFGSDVYV